MEKASNAKMMAVALCGGLLMVISGCTSFNRDALWNAAIDDNSHCTYWKSDFPVGSRFVHRQDDWTDKRLANEYELTVQQVSGNEMILEHGWMVMGGISGLDQDSAYGKRMKGRPIIVKVFNASNYKEGDMFKEYGQYKYEKDVLLNGKSAPYLIQENTCQDLVAEPYPFFFIR